MRFCIDRFEGELCLCQDERGKTYAYPRENMPQEAKEGDWLLLVDGELICDPAFTEQAKLRISEKMRRLLAP